MKRITFLVLIMAVLVIAACGGKAVPTVDMANPASKFCVDQGYKIEIRTADDGSQQGFCIFSDGTECEEWAFYRGECGPGTPKP
jgi:inhibitor of cysteine peptidase